MDIFVKEYDETVSFPDDTPQEEITRVLRENFPSKTAKPAMQQVEKPSAGLEEESSLLRRGIADPLIGLASGALVGLPETAIGLLDIPTKGAAGKFIEEKSKDVFGGTLDDLREYGQSKLSPETREAMKKVSEAEGFFGTLKTSVDNPSSIVQTIAESLPSMFGGARVGRLITGLFPKLVKAGTAGIYGGALGEGIVTTGQNVEEIRKQTEDGLLNSKQLVSGISSGVMTAAISLFGGKLAKRLGISDIDTIFADGVKPDIKKNLIKKVLLGAFQEGVIEELPQSMQEVAWQNYALGKPLDEGVLEAGAMGMLAGIGQSTGVQAYTSLFKYKDNSSDPEPVKMIKNAASFDLEQLAALNDDTINSMLRIGEGFEKQGYADKNFANAMEVLRQERADRDVKVEEETELEADETPVTADSLFGQPLDLLQTDQAIVKEPRRRDDTIDLFETPSQETTAQDTVIDRLIKKGYTQEELLEMPVEDFKEIVRAHLQAGNQINVHNEGATGNPLANPTLPGLKADTPEAQVEYNKDYTEWESKQPRRELPTQEAGSFDPNAAFKKEAEDNGVVFVGMNEIRPGYSVPTFRNDATKSFFSLTRPNQTVKDAKAEHEKSYGFTTETPDPKKLREDHKRREKLAEKVKKDVLTFGKGATFLKRGAGGALIRAQRLANKFRQDKKLTLKGETINNAADLAIAAQIYRDERVETFRVVWVKDNQVAHEEGYSSRLPNATGISKDNDLAKFASWVNSTTSRLSADKVYIMHNHPSGNPRPSAEDRTLTATLGSGKNPKRLVSKFAAHVVINDKTYAVIDSRGFFAGKDLPSAAKQQNGVINPTLGTVAPGAETDYIAFYAKDLKVQKNYVTTFFCSSEGVINAIMDLPLNLVKSNEIHNFLRGQARENGGGRIFMYAYSVDAIGADTIKNLVTEGSIEDVSVGSGLATTSANKMLSINDNEVNKLFGKDIDEYGVFRVREAPVPFDEAIPEEAEAKRKAYEDIQRAIVELPELVEMVVTLTGKFPKIRKFLGKALGKFREGNGAIDLLAAQTPEQMAKTLAHEIGHMVDWLPDSYLKRGNILAKIAAVQKYTKKLLEEYPDSPNKVLTEEDRARLRQEATKTMRKQHGNIVEEITREVPKYAEAGITPEMILGLLRGTTTQPKIVLDYLKTLNSSQMVEIAKQAFNGLVNERIANLQERTVVGTETVTEQTVRPNEDINKLINERYAELIKEEVEKRRLFEKEVIMEELKALTQKWNPIPEDATEGYKKYRNSPAELYADAISVLMNDPQMFATEAPVFNKAFFNYMDRRPSFKKAFDSIQERLTDRDQVLKHRLEFIDAMAKHGAEKRAQVTEEKRKADELSPSLLWHTIRKVLDTSNIKYIEKVNEWIRQGKFVADHQRIDYLIEQLPYVDSKIAAYTITTQKLFEKAEKDGITLQDMHSFLTLERIAFDKGRATIANPGGLSVEPAKELLDYIKRQAIEQHGEKRYNDLVKYANEFRELFYEHVTKPCLEANYLPPKLATALEENKHYVTFSHFNIEQEFNKQFSNQYGAKIYPQWGGLGEVDNVAVATMLKGVSLIRAAHYHTTKMGIVQTLYEIGNEKDIIKAPRGLRGVDFANPPEGYGLIVLSPNGKLEGFYIDQEMAEVWNRQPEKATALFRVAIATKHIIAKLFIEWNVGWTLANPIRDFLGTWKKMSGSTQHIVQAYANTMTDAFRAGWGKMPERELRLLRDGVIQADRFWKTHGNVFGSEQQVIESIEKERKIFHNEYRKFWHKFKEKGYDKFLLLPPLLRGISNLGKAGERWGKFAGDEVVRRRITAGAKIGKLERKHLIITRSGTPNALASGLATKWLEVLFPFQRIAVQDTVSGIESIREKPGTYFFKTFVFNLFPKIVAAGFVYGWFYALLKSMGVDDEGLEAIDDAAIHYKRMSTYMKRMYTVLPLGGIEIDGQTVFLKIPQDYTGQSIGAIFDALMSGQMTGVTGTLGAVGGYQPYNMNPFISTFFDWWKYYQTGEIPVNFYGSKIMSPQVAAAGGTDAFKALSRTTWNDFFGGGFYKFQSEGVERIEPQIKKAMGSFPGNALGRFVGISESGIEEEARLITEKVRKADAKRMVGIRHDVLDRINAGDVTVNENVLFEYWDEAVKKGVIDPVKQPFREFRKTYLKVNARREGSSYLRAFENTQTTNERSALLRAWEKKYPRKFEGILKELIDNNLMTRDSWRQYYIDKESEE